MRQALGVPALIAAAMLLPPFSAYAQPFSDVPSVDNPAVATYNGGSITLRNLEDYASELPKLQRCPRLVDGVVWRNHMSRELGKSILFTSQALELGQHLDPAFLRARNYYIQEWCSYAILRDNVVNRIDAGQQTLRDYYELHKSDWFVSATVSLRVIRTRDAAKATAAMERLRNGEPFEKVEADLSEMSLRQRGRIFGPFPTTETQTLIPPPEEVIEAARMLEVGETTGPLFFNSNYFIARTEAKTPARQLTFEEAVQYVDTQVRTRQGDLLTRKLLDQLKQELNVAVNDKALDHPDTRPEDVVATVGEVLIPYDEFKSLAGRVRGPALQASTLEPTPLSRFIVPTIFCEAAKRRGYVEDPDFKRALLFHDLRRIGMRMMNTLVDNMTPRVTEAEVRRYYNMNKNTKDSHGHILGQMKLEEVRGEITELLTQQKRGEIEKLIQKQILEQGNFEMVQGPMSSSLSAFEALVASADRIPAGYKIRMITSRPENEETTEATKLINCGRRKAWRIICTSDADPAKPLEITPPVPSRMYDASDHFTSCPVYLPWNRLWRFDTDGLARFAYEGGLADYMAKHRGQVHINTRVEFQWDGDKPKECDIVFEARPLSEDDDVLTFRYSGQSGSLSRKPFSECLPCEQMKRLMNEPI